MDSLDKAAQSRIQKHIGKTVSDYLKNLSKDDNPPDLAQLEIPYIPAVNPELTQDIERLFSGALLLGMDHAKSKINLADVIPSLSFDEAVSFMKSRVPVTKKEWLDLEPKLRFRAFTVARLTQLDYTDAARQVLYNAMETGKGVAETYNQWQRLQTLIKDDAMQLRPGYWENVFRTNTQTAYVTGKLMQYKNDPPPAWRLLVIDDSRTSNICRGLVKEGKNGLVLSSDHPFWKTFGFPPYHYQCRTGIQAVFKTQIEHGVEVENPDIEKMEFKPMAGFGGDPLDKESWWMMTENMALRAARYDIFNEIESLAKNNGLYNFALNLVLGEDVSRLIGTNYTVRKATVAEPLQKEIHAAKILEENGHTVFFAPENRTKKMKNYDAIIDGKLGEFKKLESFAKIKKRLNEANGQKVSIVCIEPPTENNTHDEAILVVNNWFKSSQKIIKYVDTVLLIWGGKVTTIKK
ncbi:MAG: phage minor head protein [Treponema sp.]|nr:phage minor head protein [Treponema sp.]